MRELLSKKDLRRLELVETIFLNQGITLEELTEQLLLNKVQVQTDIGFLGPIVSPLQLEITKENRCYLEIPEQYSIRYVYQVLLKESLAFRLLEEIFLESYENYDLLAEKLYISKATLKRTILALNAGLKPYEMTISARPVRLEGHERNIRAFYYFYFQERYPDHFLPIARNIQGLLDPLLATFQQTFMKRQADFAHNSRIRMQLFVSMMREKFGYSVTSHYLLDQATETKIKAIIAELNLTTKMQEIFEQELTVDLYKRFFYRYLEGMYSFNLFDFTDSKSQQPSTKAIFTNVQKMIQTISQLIDIPVQNIEELTLRIYNVIALTSDITIPPYILFQNRKTFLSLSRHLPASFVAEAQTIFKEYLPSVEARNSAYFDEIFYLLTIYWPAFYEYLVTTVEPCKIGLFLDSDEGHRQYVKERLDFLFGKKIEVTIYQTETLVSIEDYAQEVDFFVMNFIFPEKLLLSKDYLCVSDVITNEDMRKLEKKIDTIYYRHLNGKLIE